MIVTSGSDISSLIGSGSEVLGGGGGGGEDMDKLASSPKNGGYPDPGRIQFDSDTL